jgi:hypothetical protein
VPSGGTGTPAPNPMNAAGTVTPGGISTAPTGAADPRGSPGPDPLPDGTKSSNTAGDSICGGGVASQPIQAVAATRASVQASTPQRPMARRQQCAASSALIDTVSGLLEVELEGWHAMSARAIASESKRTRNVTRERDTSDRGKQWKG